MAQNLNEIKVCPDCNIEKTMNDFMWVQDEY